MNTPDRMDPDWQHIVIGAGISGLGLAHYAAREDISTLVLEGAERVGGCLDSRSFPDCDGFWAEAGAHTGFNSYGHLLDILADLGMMQQLIPKAKLRYALWRGGKRHSIFSALHPLALALSLPRLLTTPKQDNRVADYYGRIFGRSNYRDLFGPAFRAVICQQADDFPADLLFRRKPQRKGVTRSFTLPGGLSDIPRAIADQERIQVRTGQQVRAVHRDGHGFCVRMKDGSELTSRYLSLAVPPESGAGLLGEGFENLRAMVSGIALAQVESVVLCVLAADLPRLPPLAGLIAVDDAFYSMTTRDYLPDERYRGFTFHFRPGALDAKAQLECACQALGIGVDRICGIHHTLNRLPALGTGHHELVRRIDQSLAGGQLAITGNWFLGISIEDCLSRSREEATRLFGPGERS